MKKTILISFILGISLCAQAQNYVSKDGSPIILGAAIYKPTFYTGEEAIPKGNDKSISKKTEINPWEFEQKVIGTSNYDLQTNGSIANRIVNNSDGTISVVWTKGTNIYPSFDDRGTGYNYFDGTSWLEAPSGRIETTRTGFPSIAVTGTGKEIIISHRTEDPEKGLLFNSRATKGAGSWAANDTLKSPIAGGNWWPRIVTGGTDKQTLHVISLTAPTNLSGGEGQKYKGLNGALTYSRSTNGGISFDINNVIIPGIDSTNLLGIGTDAYAIDAKDSNVAIVTSGGFFNDVVLLKSTDNGSTWTKTIIYKFPIENFYRDTTMISDLPPYDGIVDTILSHDDSYAVLLDTNGKAHVWYGAMRIMKPTEQGTYYNFPGTDGLYYWNESMDGSVIIAQMLDLNGDGIITLPKTNGNDKFPFGSYGNSLTSFPSTGIDANGTIYLSYSSIYELTDNGNGKAYRHVYLRRSDDNGATWNKPLDVTVDEYSEGVFASVAKNVDNKVHLVYQRDGNPGHSSFSPDASEDTDPDNNNGGNDIVYVAVTTKNLLEVGINQNERELNNVFIYPNPVSDMARINFNILKPGLTNLAIYDILGQEIEHFTLEHIVSGLHAMNLNVENYKPGIYFVNCKINNQVFTQKLIVR